MSSTFDLGAGIAIIGMAGRVSGARNVGGVLGELRGGGVGDGVVQQGQAVVQGGAAGAGGGGAKGGGVEGGVSVGQGGLAGLRSIVCTVTGHGLKDPERAMAVSPAVESVEAGVDALRRAVLE